MFHGLQKSLPPSHERPSASSPPPTAHETPYCAVSPPRPVLSDALDKPGTSCTSPPPPIIIGANNAHGHPVERLTDDGADRAVSLQQPDPAAVKASAGSSPPKNLTGPGSPSPSPSPAPFGTSESSGPDLEPDTQPPAQPSVSKVDDSAADRGSTSPPPRPAVERGTDDGADSLHQPGASKGVGDNSRPEKLDCPGVSSRLTSQTLADAGKLSGPPLEHETQPPMHIKLDDAVADHGPTSPPPRTTVARGTNGCADSLHQPDPAAGASKDVVGGSSPPKKFDNPNVPSQMTSQTIANACKVSGPPLKDDTQPPTHSKLDDAVAELGSTTSSPHRTVAEHIALVVVGEQSATPSAVSSDLESGATGPGGEQTPTTNDTIAVARSWAGVWAVALIVFTPLALNTHFMGSTRAAFAVAAAGSWTGLNNVLDTAFPAFRNTHRKSLWLMFTGGVASLVAWKGFKENMNPVK